MLATGRYWPPSGAVDTILSFLPTLIDRLYKERKQRFSHDGIFWSSVPLLQLATTLVTVICDEATLIHNYDNLICCRFFFLRGECLGCLCTHTQDFADMWKPYVSCVHCMTLRKSIMHA